MFDSAEFRITVMSLKKRQFSQKGAVLIIILLLLGASGASLFLAGMKFSGHSRVRQIRTQTILGEAREALLGFATKNGRLPRPAISNSDGRESPFPCQSDRDCTGFLPWATLGLPFANGGAILRYSVSPDFTTSPIDFSKSVATKTVQTRVSGKLHYIAGQPVCERSSQCIPAIVFSSGSRNFGNVASPNTVTSQDQTRSDERANLVSAINYIQRPQLLAGSVGEGGEFDDQLVWVPLLPLINRITSGLPGPS